MRLKIRWKQDEHKMIDKHKMIARTTGESRMNVRWSSDKHKMIKR